jgi:hypothetical protein
LSYPVLITIGLATQRCSSLSFSFIYILILFFIPAIVFFFCSQLSVYAAPVSGHGRSLSFLSVHNDKLSAIGLLVSVGSSLTMFSVSINLGAILVKQKFVCVILFSAK